MIIHIFLLPGGVKEHANPVVKTQATPRQVFISEQLQKSITHVV